MNQIITMLIGAVLSVATGAIVNYIDYLMKKDKYIYGISYEMKNYEKLTKMLMMSERDFDSKNISLITITIPNFLSRIEAFRAFSLRFNDWMLELKSIELREKLSEFYLQSNELMGRIKHNIN